MLETSSAKAAEAMTQFASPMLASVERFLSRLAGRIGEPPSLLSGRSLQLADHIFSRRLGLLGMGLPGGEAGFVERQAAPQAWLLPPSWIPAAADLRGGGRPAAPAAQPLVPRSPVAAPARPTTTTSPKTETTTGTTTETTETAAAAPVTAEALAAPAAVPALRSPTATERLSGPVAMPQVAPWMVEPAAATAETTRRRAAPVAESASAAAPASTAEVTPASAPAVAAPSMDRDTVGALDQDQARTPASLAAVAVAGAAPTAAAPADAAAVDAAPTAAKPTDAAAVDTTVAAAKPADAAAVDAALAGAVPAAAREAATAAAEAAAPGRAAARQETPRSAGTAALAAPAASEQPFTSAVAPARAAATSAPLVDESASVHAAVAPSAAPSRLPRAVDPAPAGVAAPRAPGVPAASEERVRDLLPSVAPVRPGAPSGRPFVASALARSFAHLGWSDDRLGRPTAERGPATTLNLEVAEAPSVRAAAAPALPMVQADELKRAGTPRATRPTGGAAFPAPSAAPAATAHLPEFLLASPDGPSASPEATHEAAPPSVSSDAAAPTSAAVPAAVVDARPAASRAVATRDDAVRAPDEDAATTAAPAAVMPGALHAAAVTAAHVAGDASALPAPAPAILTAADVAASTLPLPRPTPTEAAAPPLAQPSSGLARINLASGSGPAALSPSLLASPALQSVGAGASLARLFLSGPSVSGAAGAPALPARMPGALAAATEQLATTIGTTVAAGSAGVDNPFGGGQAWRHAPGMASVVSRALAESEPTVPARWAPMALGAPLPYLPAPSAERRLPGRAASMAPGQPLLTTGVVDHDAAPAATPGMGAAAPTLAPTAAAPGPLAAPWQLAGGMATLAELFAAGVGLGTGAASQIAHQAGVAPATGLLPAWLSRAAGARLGLAATASPSEREVPRGAPLEFVARDLLPPAARAEAARWPFSPTMGVPPVATDSASSIPGLRDLGTDTLTPPSLAGEAAAPRPSFWQHAGGLASSAEAFARGHGIDRADQAAASSPTAEGGRWVPVTGGMVFVGREASRPPAAVGPTSRGARPAAPLAASGAAGAPRPIDQEAPSPEFAVASPASTPDAMTPVREPEAALAQTSPMFASAATAEPAAEPASGSAPSLERSVDWRRAGGVGLRTELFAVGLGSAFMSASPLSAARELPQWSTAPGIAGPLARALSQSEQPMPARWSFGDSGLLFLSAPSAAAKPARAQAARTATQAATVGQPETPSAAVASELPLIAAPAPSPTTQRFLPTTTPDAGLPGEGAAARPWQHAGGTAILAELFAAGVGLGAGAAGGLAQQAGVGAGRSLMPAWLDRLLAPDTALAGEPGERPTVAMPMVPRDERRPSAATVARSATRPLAGAAPSAGLPFAPASDEAETAATATDAAFPGRLPSAVAASGAPWQHAGGLAASAEAFARGRGLERAGDAAAAEDDGEAPAGRWLSVSGAMVFVPEERPAPAKAQRPLRATRTLLPPTVSPTPEAAVAASPQAAAAAGGVGGWQQAGGLGLRSELFAAGLGPMAATATPDRDEPLGGWAAAHRMLTAFRQPAEAAEAAPPARFAWSGPGGLLYLAGDRPTREAPRRRAAPRPRLETPAVETEIRPADAAPAGERFGRLADEPARGAAGRAPLAAGMLPLPSLFGDEASPAVGGASRSPSGASLPGRLGTSLLTGFPRPAGGEAPQALWPTTAQHGVERISSLLAQLPTQWRPSQTLLAAMQASDMPTSPLWQRLPVGQPKGGLVGRGLPGADDDERGEPAFGERPHLTLVQGSQPGAQKEQPAAEPAWKQQTPESMVGAALQKVAGSGTPLAAAAKMLEAMRGHGAGHGTRVDERLSLGDLTLIALQMGQNKMAAISSSSREPVSAPPLEDANRQRELPNGPETEDSLQKKVHALAERVAKEVEKMQNMDRERNSFDA